MISNRYISRTPCLFTRISSSYNILSLFYLVVISLGYPSLSRQYRLSSIRSLQNNYNLPPPLPIIDTGFKKTIRVQREEKFRYPSRRVDGPRKGLHPGLAWKKKEEEKKERERKREIENRINTIDWNEYPSRAPGERFAFFSLRRRI